MSFPDPYKIGTNSKIPYIAIPIKDIETRKLIDSELVPEWFECNGIKVFQVKDKDGKSTKKYMAFLLLLPPGMRNNNDQNPRVHSDVGEDERTSS